MLSRIFVRRNVAVCLTLSSMIMFASCSRLNKRNDGGGQQGGSTADEGGNSQPVESTDTETGGSAVAEKDSLSGEDTIYVEEGVELATDVTGAYLTLPPGVERGGASISVRPGKADTKITSFITVKIPLDLQIETPSASLMQDVRELVLFFQLNKPDGSAVIGVRPVAKEQIVGNEIVIQSPFFGAFQAGYIKKVLTAPIEKQVIAPVFTKVEEKAIAPLNWSPVTAAVAVKTIKFSTQYTSASPVTSCEVWITKDTANGAEVLRQSVPHPNPEILFTAPEQGVPFFAHFQCQYGLLSAVNSSVTGSLVAVTAPLALNFSGSIDEDVASELPLQFDSTGSKPDACAVVASDKLLNASCACANGACTASVKSNADYNGPAFLDFTLTYKTVASDVRRASLTVNPVQDAPVADSRNMGAVLLNSSQNIVFSYADADGDKADSCQVTGVQNTASNPDCTCINGLCSAGVSFTQAGSGFVKYTVTAAGMTSEIATVQFEVAPALPPAVRFLNLDFAYPTNLDPVDLKPKIKLSGGANINDYDFYFVSAPEDATANVVNYGGAPNGNMFPVPVYTRGNPAKNYDSFQFALMHRESGNWVVNASPTSPARAFTCNAAAYTGWNSLRQGTTGPYLVCSASQFKDIAQKCSGGSSDSCSSKFRQIADLDIATVTPMNYGIGWEVPFQGHYDGAGHTIRNFQPSSFGGYDEGAGLFGILGGTAKIERLRLESIVLDLYSLFAPATNFGLLAGRADGTDIIIDNIEIHASRIVGYIMNTNIGGLIGRAASGVRVSNIRISDLEILLPPGIYAGPIGAVFGLAEQGAVFERVSVESDSRIQFATTSGAATVVGGIGGAMKTGAKLDNSYTRVQMNCSGTDSYYIGKILGTVDGATTSLTNVYADVILGSCEGSPFGHVAAIRLVEAPVLSGIHVLYNGRTEEMYVYGNDAGIYSGVGTHNSTEMISALFSGWDFVNVWQRQASRPPILRK